MIDTVRSWLRRFGKPDDEGIGYYCPSCRALPGSPCTERVRMLGKHMLEPENRPVPLARTHRARRGRG